MTRTNMITTTNEIAMLTLETLEPILQSEEKFSKIL